MATAFRKCGCPLPRPSGFTLRKAKRTSGNQLPIQDDSEFDTVFPLTIPKVQPNRGSPLYLSAIQRLGSLLFPAAPSIYALAACIA